MKIWGGLWNSVTGLMEFCHRAYGILSQWTIWLIGTKQGYTRRVCSSPKSCKYCKYCNGRRRLATRRRAFPPFRGDQKERSGYATGVMPFACLHLVAWNFFGSDLKNFYAKMLPRKKKMLGFDLRLLPLNLPWKKESWWFSWTSSMKSILYPKSLSLGDSVYRPPETASPSFALLAATAPVRLVTALSRLSSKVSWCGIAIAVTDIGAMWTW